MEILLLLLFVILTFGKEVERLPFVQAPIENLDTFYTFSSTKSSTYRTLSLSNDLRTLHIGGVKMVFGQKADDIRKTSYSSVPWEVTKDQQKTCEVIPGSKHGEKCYNMIQIIHQLNSTHILICGSNGFKPKNKILSRENEDQDFVLAEDRMTKGSLCSCDPDDSVSSLLIPDENGIGIFSTQRSEVDSEIAYVKSMPTNIVFPEKKTQKDVISSFYVNDAVMGRQMKKVYFVSDEKVVEPLHYPTITQVCANDIGGKNVLKNRWTSLLKVRLLCQTGENYPLVFDKVTDMTMGSDQILYGTFTTRHETSRANAVCSFRLADIQKAFNEADIYEGDDTSKIAIIPESNTLRPGICAYSGMIPDNAAASTSKYFPKTHLLFMSQNYLVADVVKAAYPTNADVKKPLLIKAGEKFTKIAVEQVTSVDKTTFDVVFVGKEDGSVYKFVAIPKGNQVETLELAHYQPSTDPILSMKLSQELGYIYIGTNKGVHQISTSNCAAYTKSCEFCDPCRMCVLSRDPGCAWDMEAGMCVSTRGNGKLKLHQDVIHGDAVAQCGDLSAPNVDSKKATSGQTEMLGHIVKNPNVVYTWHIDDSEDQIKDKPGKYRITPDGQLEISNFASADIAAYKCDYTVNSVIVNSAVFDFKGSTDIPPIVSVSSKSGIGGTNTLPTITTNQTRTVSAPRSSTTSATPITQAGLQIGIITGILMLVILIAVLLIVIKCRKKKKYSPTKGEESSKNMVATDFTASPVVRQEDNRTENNNSNRLRFESEYDTQAGRPLLQSRAHQTSVDDPPETQLDNLPAPSQRNTKSLDDLNDRDSIGFIDDDDGAVSDEQPTQKLSGSVREKTGRKRVPPARTKSMPGSELYVVFGGKKVKCSTLQRNKDGNWTIQVRPNQSILQSFEKDDVIDILDDSETLDSDQSTRNRQFIEETPKTKSSAALQNAENRRAFFEVDSSKASADRSQNVQYMTSTPNSMSAKPFSIADGAKKSLTEQHSQASLRSLGQNSSEDRDSDTTVKGSSMTLQHEDTPSVLCKTQTATKKAVRQNSYAAVPAFQNSSDVPAVSSSNKNRKHRTVKNNDSYSSDKSLDRSSGSSDGDEQLHGRDKNVSRKGKRPMDSPSKESRTSQGSSSSGDYRSARSSMISEQSHDHR